MRRELHAGLAEPRATAVVLAGLPLLGLVMGTALGADPLAWLLGTVAGRSVLALGVLLEVVGAWWAWRIAVRLESRAVSPLLLVVLAAVAVLLAVPGGPPSRRRRPCRRVPRRGGGRARGPARRPRSSPSRRWCSWAVSPACCSARCSLSAYACSCHGCRAEQERRRAEGLARQAPLTVDLVAACLASGAPPEVAVEAAARAVGAPTCEVLLPAVAALRLGADPGSVWDEVARVDGLAALARAFARSQHSGAALSDLLPRVADEVRAAARARAEARIRTAAVRLTAPLGAALLPAFVLLGVVPVVASWVGVLL